MRNKRFEPSTTKNDGGDKEKHKVTITRKAGSGKWSKVGEAYDRFVFRAWITHKLYSLAEPQVIDFIEALSMTCF
ncbi:hypothetical protein KDX00_00350 [Cobetia amphilecti]|nr:hypothetical protein KDX00_00350 [Cobetia litoralis]